MKIRLSFLYSISFLLLTIVMMELHETVHILVGRFICGCWGTRDFNVWSLCKECDTGRSLSWVATISGPLFSYALMWIGARWLRSSSEGKKALGFSLIFANIPFGRISQVMKGAGDEIVVAKHLLQNDFSGAQIIMLCSIVVLVIGLPPLICSFRALTNKYRWLYFIGFCTLPVLFILIYILLGMNSLLKSGVLCQVGIMGTPLLITIHTLIALFFLLLLRRSIFTLNETHAK